MPSELLMTTIDHKAPHLWIRLHTGIRCAYMLCDALPDAEAIARLEAEAAQLRTMADGVRRPSMRNEPRLEPGLG